MLRRSPIVAAALLVLSAPAHAQSPAERELYRLEETFAQAVVRRDAAALRALVAPRWVYSDESGVMTRDDGIRAFTSGADTVREAGNDRMRAIVYGNTAVVIGELWMRGRGPKGAFTRRYRYTDTWLLTDGRWRCIASQDWLMPEARR
jgi:ketosteroid isomerase-like protein